MRVLVVPAKFRKQNYALHGSHQPLVDCLQTNLSVLSHSQIRKSRETLHDMPDVRTMPFCRCSECPADMQYQTVSRWREIDVQKSGQVDSVVIRSSKSSTIDDIKNKIKKREMKVKPGIPAHSVSAVRRRSSVMRSDPGPNANPWDWEKKRHPGPVSMLTKKANKKQRSLQTHRQYKGNG